MSTYIASYDITENKIRTRLSKYLSRYGNRLQKSVFMVKVPAWKRKSFVEGIEKITGPAGDVILIRLCRGCMNNAIRLSDISPFAHFILGKINYEQGLKKLKIIVI